MTSKRRTKVVAAPPASPPPMVCKTELIGLDEDGNMSLWDIGDVQPITEFGGNDFWIENGHYVIQWKGHAITVYCNGSAFGTINIQFMCSRNWSIALPRPEVEAMLLGKVIRDPEHHARIMLTFDRLFEALHARQQAPHLRRGKI